MVTPITATRWMTSNYSSPCMKQFNNFKSKDHMYPRVRKFYSKDTGATIHVKILLSGHFDQHIYNMYPCIAPSCRLIILTHENYCHISVESLNTDNVISITCALG